MEETVLVKDTKKEAFELGMKIIASNNTPFNSEFK